VSPFIDHYVVEKLSTESMGQLQSVLATFYTTQIIKMKSEFEQDQDEEKFNKDLQRLEKNIRACLKYFFPTSGNRPSKTSPLLFDKEIVKMKHSESQYFNSNLLTVKNPPPLNNKKQF